MYDIKTLRKRVQALYRVLMQFEIGRACAYYNRTHLDIALLEPSVRPSILTVALLYSRILHRTEANGTMCLPATPHLPRSLAAQWRRAGVTLVVKRRQSFWRW